MAQGNLQAPISPLEGVRVLDMTRVIAGPLATQVLGDLGADVIKVERIDGGDDVRHVGPPWMPHSREGADASTYFESVNRNKRSIAVSFENEEGQGLLRRLAAQCDILIENFRPGTLGRYGLGYDDLKAVNPRLVYCSVTGFGQDGTYASRSGYDYLIQGMTGLMGVTGHPADALGGGPMRVGIPLVDIFAGMNAGLGILAALRHRDNTGIGQHIDISLFDSGLASMLNPVAAWFNSGLEIELTSNDHPSAAPYGVFEVADGYVIIATFSDRDFVRLADVLGHPEWSSDPRFATNENRVAHRAELKQAVSQVTKGYEKQELEALLNGAKVSCGPINTMADLETNPHVLDRQSIRTLEHPRHGPVRTVASPLRFSQTPVCYHRAPPELGEHTGEILDEILGLSQADIEALRQKGIVALQEQDEAAGLNAEQCAPS